MAELKDRYAAALFDLSLEENRLEEHMAQAVFVRDILAGDEPSAFLVHPHIPDRAKQDFMQSLFKDQISDTLMGFLHQTITRGREALIVPSLTAYIARGNRHMGKVMARIVSAAPLREGQVNALTAMLSKKLNKQVSVQTRVDPALMGGLYIHVDGRLIDRSVRTQLKNMKESMIRGGAE